MFKLCAVVSSYFPYINEFENNINSYLEWVDWLIIWENTPQNSSRIAELARNLNSPKIEVRTTGQNEYLAKPFNICIEWAKENGFTHILTMDQDSCFEDGHFQRYIQNVKQCNIGSVAVFSPNTGNFNIQTEPLEIQSAITSGAIIPLNVFNQFGMFNEDFLIYNIDIEFCRRVRSFQQKIIAFTGIQLIHSEGYKKRSKAGFVVINYSAQSTYYIIRNTILLWKLYPKTVTASEKFNFYKYKVVYRTVKLIFEHDRLRKFKAVFYALIHGHLSRKGKYEV